MCIHRSYLEILSNLSSIHAGIPASVQPVLLEALEAWRRAESKKESDITLAKMSYSRAASEWVNVLHVLVTY